MAEISAGLIYACDVTICPFDNVAPLSGPAGARALSSTAGPDVVSLRAAAGMCTSGRRNGGVALAEVSLDDKYTRDSGRIYLTGIQALVRLPMLQRARDLAAGHDTAGYISGYRGSPLGGLDQQLMAARRFLEQHHVVFQPGVNEDLAATALWGTQQAGLHGEGRYHGVFGMWYGKGPGVDRTGDAFRHANLAGTARLGGVLVLMGDAPEPRNPEYGRNIRRADLRV